MRRGLLKELPALSYWFGIKPVDLDDMTFDEIDEYLKALRDITKKLKK